MPAAVLPDGSSCAANLVHLYLHWQAHCALAHIDPRIMNNQGSGDIPASCQSQARGEHRVPRRSCYYVLMPTPLRPDQLTPAASLNRVRIVDLPGEALDPEVRGRLAYDLLSTAAIAAHLRRQGGALQIEDVDTLEDAALPPILDRCFRSADPAVRAAAENIAISFGRALGFVLLVLKRGDAPNRLARDDWDDSYWAHWRGIRRVVLGGGLVSGSLGQHLLPYTRDLLARYGADCSVEIARHAPLLPLIGAARSLPVGLSAALVCDFGQSRIKRACAISQDGTHLMCNT